MDGGLHKEHYTTLCEEQLNDLTQLAAVRNYPFYISPAHRRNEWPTCQIYMLVNWV